MSFRLLALDMDGTLLNSSKEMTPRTAAALHKLQQQGWLVTLVSGRRPMGMVDIARDLQLTCPIAAFNGGLLLDPHELRVLDMTAIALPQVQDLLQTWLEAKVSARFYTGAFSGAEYYYFCEDKLLSVLPDLALMQSQGRAKRIYNVADIDFEPLRLMAGGNEEETLRAKELAEPWLHNNNLWALLTKDYDDLWFLEIFPNGVNKGNGLRKLCALLDISLSEVIAVGDQLNDMEMIQSAGLGVAMGNAIPALKQVAKHVIGDHNQDGLAIFVENLCRGKIVE